MKLNKPMNLAWCILFFISCKTTANVPFETNGFEIVTSTNKASIIYEKGLALDSISAHLLAEDIFNVTSYRPKVITNIKEAKGNVIVIGGLTSSLVSQFISESVIPENFKTQWESYLYKTVSNPTKTIVKALVIAGTNARGTAYGVFNISKRIGVNPWCWWADVPVKISDELILHQPDFKSKEPSVTYRGIFLNDEDWGLQPWAAKTFEPETGDIGPKTYAKIFELLLRLNANTIWPAMHESTKAFFYYPGNAKMAELYNIVIGTSHAEPMLRNNVDEWDKEQWGRFNYKTNKANVYSYWENRVKEAKNIDGIYTIGMRGVHDSGMEGVKSKDEAVEVLTEVLADQRGMLKKHINNDVTKVPQAFTVYKEVLDLYKNGLEVPEDITLVWTDDNYGYIRALSNDEEQQRPGGAGVYYHASYWGRPHDYLWLDTTNPYLIWEEMMKAHKLNNKEIWILNVGDIKPAEYSTQLFLDIAYNADNFENIEAVTKHQQHFFNAIFGKQYGTKISEIKTTYYQLAFERKPEFMGWSQTEPTTPISKSNYNTLGNGDEISQRIAAYQTIEDQARTIETQLPENLKSPFVQLVSYPIEAASNMNKKFLYRDKALTYAVQGRKSVSKYKFLSNRAYDNIMRLTQKYNTLSNGKWQGIMDMKPRRLPVFDNPDITVPASTKNTPIGLSVEDNLTTPEGLSILPSFCVNSQESYFIDIFLIKANQATWNLSNAPKWIKLSRASGKLTNDRTLEERVYVSINWGLWQQTGKPLSEIITVESENFSKNIQINISESYSNLPKNSIVEKNGTIVWYAENFIKNEAKAEAHWKLLSNLGHSNNTMQALPFGAKPFSNYNNAPFLEYNVYTETITPTATLSLVALPTHPLTTNGEVKIAVQWNNNPIEIINFKTEGRSLEWKQNVLCNKAIKQLSIPITAKGKQTLKIYMVDSGVLLDYMVLQTKNSELLHSLLPETKLNTVNK
ncbi:MAG: glycosyl hydrolase 115 family protein [Flavobacteriaceae bacterium]